MTKKRWLVPVVGVVAFSGLSWALYEAPSAHGQVAQLLMQGPCRVDADCQDGNFCNGAEVCDQGGRGVNSRGCRSGGARCTSGNVCREHHQMCLPTGLLCQSDAQCDDGVFCNGAERCRPADATSDARGCTRTAACSSSQMCLEDSDRCVQRCYDRDGDGHLDRACGGDDCNDADANTYPGNIEVCDADRHDEDCDPSTFGFRDQDNDGHVDSRCCNGSTCGTDCDDTRSAVSPNAQICNLQNVAFCDRSGAFTRMSCPTGTVCVPQPNGLGVCTVQPPGYQTPPAVFPPTLSPLPRVQSSAVQPGNSQVQQRTKTRTWSR